MIHLDPPHPSRRTFLGAASAAVLSACSRPIAAAPTDRWQPRWILSSALYGNVPLAEVLPEVRKTGAATIDLWPKPHGTQRDEVDALGVEKVRELLAAADVAVGGIACYMVGPFNLAGEFAVASRLGAKEPVLVTMAPGDGSLAGDALTAATTVFLEKLRPSLAAAEEAGGVIAIENHSHSLLQTPDSIRRFAALATHDSLGIALAPHHLPQEGELVAALARDLGPKLKFVYAQQHGKGAKEKLPKEDELLQLPGRGKLDFGPLMRQLAAMRFAGPIEIFMHPVPRGVPILGSVAEITAEVNRARGHLESLLGS
ncbi:MAG: sugar phosphate isomerase/epimerase family protein [Planctomycetia bacterium]